MALIMSFHYTMESSTGGRNKWRIWSGGWLDLGLEYPEPSGAQCVQTAALDQCNQIANHGTRPQRRDRVDITITSMRQQQG